MHENNDNGAGFVSGFFAGAALGAMAAVFLTPRSGRELRRELRDEGNRLRDRASEGVQEMRERRDGALEKTRETARDAAEGLKEAAEILKTGKTRVGAG